MPRRGTRGRSAATLRDPGRGGARPPTRSGRAAAHAGFWPQLGGAAKPHKWGAHGSAVWIGKGFDANALIVWVPQHKAAHALLVISEVFDGTCTVALYMHLVGFLEDLVPVTGGGEYRMKGLRAPLQEGNEVDEGPTALVRMRKQMQGRLTQWRRKLLDFPGASMNTQAARARPKSGYTTGYWDQQQSCFRYYRIHVRSIRGSCSRTHPAFGIVRV